MKITVHYLNGSTYTLKGEDYWWAILEGELCKSSGKEHFNIYRDFKGLIHSENVEDLLAIEILEKDGSITIIPFKECCVIKTGVYTKKSWDWVCNGLQKLRWSGV